MPRTMHFLLRATSFKIVFNLFNFKSDTYKYLL